MRCDTLTDDQIKHMVDRFLAWRFPRTFNPDGGVTFHPSYPDEPMRSRHWPVGTNVLTATEAEQMVRHLLDGLPHDSAGCALPDDVVNLVRAARRAAWDDGDINTLADLDEAVSVFDGRVPEDDAAAA